MRQLHFKATHLGDLGYSAPEPKDEAEKIIQRDLVFLSFAACLLVDTFGRKCGDGNGHRVFCRKYNDLGQKRHAIDRARRPDHLLYSGEFRAVCIAQHACKQPRTDE